MKKILFILLFIVSTNVGAFYPQNKAQTNLLSTNTANYERYIRPLMRGMLSEFYIIIKKINPFLGTFIELKDRGYHLKKTWEEISRECTKITAKCQNKIPEIKDSLIKLNSLIDTIQVSLTSELKLALTNPDDTLFINKTLVDISNNSRLALNQLEINDPSFQVDTLSPAIFEIGVYTELLLTKSLKRNIQNDFDFIWNHFFKSLEQDIIPTKDEKVFFLQLEDLNISWNRFHMKLLKDQNPDKLPKGLDNIITTMHTRWTTILKLIINE